MMEMKGVPMMSMTDNETNEAASGMNSNKKRGGTNNNNSNKSMTSSSRMKWKLIMMLMVLPLCLVQQPYQHVNAADASYNFLPLQQHQQQKSQTNNNNNLLVDDDTFVSSPSSSPFSSQRPHSVSCIITHTIHLLHFI